MSADEMFDELGWNYKENHANGVSFYDDEDNEISIIDSNNYGRRININKLKELQLKNYKQ